MTLDRERSAGYLTNWAARLFAREMDRRLGEVGMSSGYVPVFFALAAGIPRSQKDLAQLAAVEQPTMAATLARMARDKLITRVADPGDGRSALISLTPLAKKKALAVQAAVMGINKAALAGLSPAEQAQYLALIRRVIAALDSPDEGGGGESPSPNRRRRPKSA